MPDIRVLSSDEITKLSEARSSPTVSNRWLVTKALSSTGAAEFIKTHVVQAELNEEGHYKMAASQQMAEDQPPEGWVEPPPQKCS